MDLTFDHTSLAFLQITLMGKTIYGIIMHARLFNPLSSPFSPYQSGRILDKKYPKKLKDGLEGLMEKIKAVDGFDIRPHDP